MCENTWTTSPADITCITFATSYDELEFANFFKGSLSLCEDGGCMRSSWRSVYGMSAILDAEAFAPDKLGNVGNSCKPAKSPVSIQSESISQLSVYSPPWGRRTSRNQRSRLFLLRHSMTLTESSSSLGFLRSAFIGYIVTDPLSSSDGIGSQTRQSSSISASTAPMCDVCEMNSLGGGQDPLN